MHSCASLLIVRSFSDSLLKGREFNTELPSRELPPQPGLGRSQPSLGRPGGQRVESRGHGATPKDIRLDRQL